MEKYTRNECKTLVFYFVKNPRSHVISRPSLLNVSSFDFSFSTRLECGFTSSPLVSSVVLPNTLEYFSPLDPDMNFQRSIPPVSEWGRNYRATRPEKPHSKRVEKM